jgi:hypothetical protein
MAERPLLAAAFLCERVLQEKDDVLTAIRIIDTLYVSIPPNLPPEAKPVIQITALLGFKKASPSSEIEKHQATVRLRSPLGKEIPENSRDLFFQPGDIAGANLILNINMEVEEFGLFWLDVSVDGELVTRIPFRLLEKPANPPETIH